MRIKTSREKVGKIFFATRKFKGHLKSKKVAGNVMEESLNTLASRDGTIKYDQRGAAWV